MLLGVYSLVQRAVILLITSQVALSSAVILPCTNKIQEQGGPDGFGTSYRTGNRFQVDMVKAMTKNVRHSPAEFHDKVKLSIDSQHFTLDKLQGGQRMTRFYIMLKNDDTSVRRAQLAWSSDLKEVPLMLFTFPAPASSVITGCVEVAATFDSMAITLQAF